MKGLIAALQFLWQFMKNPEDKYPTICDYNILYVCGIDFSKMSCEQVKTLVSVHGFYPELICTSETINENFDWGNITEEQWKLILENNYLDNYVYSFRYGGC